MGPPNKWLGAIMVGGCGPFYSKINLDISFIFTLKSSEWCSGDNVRDCWLTTAHVGCMGGLLIAAVIGEGKDITTPDIFMDHSKPLMTCFMLRMQQKQAANKQKKLNYLWENNLIAYWLAE